MRLHVDHRDAVVLAQRLVRNRVDVDVEQIHHPEVLRPRHPLNRADDRRRLGAAQDVAQRQAAGHRVGIRIVVQHDQHAVGVAEIALVLLHARARQGAAEFGEQRPAEQLGHRQVGDVGEFGPRVLMPLRADAEDVDERAARVAHRVDDLLGAALAVVLDDDAGGGAEIRLEPGVGAARVADGDRDARVVQLARQRPLFDDELDLEAGQQDLVEHPDDQLVLTDG